MKKILTLCWLFVLAGSSFIWAQGTMAFTVSMDNPTSHYYHVEFRCDGLQGATQDFKMPVWMPGYYRIMDYSKDVIRFKVVDGTGRALPGQRKTKIRGTLRLPMRLGLRSVMTSMRLRFSLEITIWTRIGATLLAPELTCTWQE